MRNTILALLLIALLAIGASMTLAQGDTTTDTGGSTVQFFYVVCPTSGVMNLTGFMEAGDDVFYQLFDGPAASGQALTTLRRVSVDGDYAFSEELPYNNGAQIADFAVGSARVLIAPENDPGSPSFETTVDDVQDGCAPPQNTAATSLDAGDPVPETQTTTTGSGILSPFGGELNPGVVITPQPVVVIGAREDVVPGRNADAGLIFAECDAFKPGADPGLLYDTDPITIFWSWFAATPELVTDHLNTAIYSVKLNTAPVIDVLTSPIEQRGDNYWVFWTSTVGPLRPGHYEIEFKLDWTQPISDGFDEFGPGTANPRVRSLCNFDVQPDPTGRRVATSNIYNPTLGPVHDLGDPPVTFP
ncbi:MAG: hypothetical protein D6737_13330 [Chloroflexi bacterium]|nr:MAG: hypothetical protein D6737_13330 [Chloroflexota bacterium]